MKKNFIAILLAFLICIVSITVFAQEKPKVKFSVEVELKEDLEKVPCKDEERLEAVKKLFEKMGARAEEVKVDSFKGVENVVVQHKGKTEETIIVGAHYDKVDAGCGAIDNWTGIVTIAHLYRTVKTFSTNKTYVFVAFGKEELGLIGSDKMADAIPKEKRESYCSMVNIDSFGLGVPQVLKNASTQKMTDLAEKVAKEMNIPFNSANVFNADTDSTSFIRKRIPAISFHGLSGQWQAYLHTGGDKLSNVNTASVYYGYRFTLSYLAQLDAMSCDAFR